MADPNPDVRKASVGDLSPLLGVIPPPLVPDHELIRPIGRGSYGEVWLARNIMNTWRAVKIVYRRSFDSDRPYLREFDGIRRFEPVSRSHPSQLNILHVGRDDSTNCFYYVMELADSAGRSEFPELHSGASTEAGPGIEEPDGYEPRTLRFDLKTRGRLPFDDCLSIGHALATALEHLHRHGLVHRDIKPSNIVFVHSIPKLADIGLVTHLEATLSFVGTEGYLPPEGPGTPQADIYSLGKVLYEMATGRDRQDYPELPTNLIELPAADRALLAELNEIIVKACEPNAAKRYRTASELQSDLALLQSGKSLARLRTAERRLKTLARVGVLVTLLALVAGAAWFWQQRQTAQARKLAEEKTQLANEKREQVVRLSVANGVRELDHNGYAESLVWFTHALPMVSNFSAQDRIHRIRIQQVLDPMPKLLRVWDGDTRLRVGIFSPDGRRVVTGSRDGRVCVREIESGRVIWDRAVFNNKDIFQLRFSTDGSRLFISSSDMQTTFRGLRDGRHFLTVRDAVSGEVIPNLTENLVRNTTNLAFSTISPDGRWFGLCLSNHIIRILSADDGAVVTEMKGHTNDVRMLAFNSDGTLVASASRDRTARLWRVPSGDSVMPPLEHGTPVRRVALNTTGSLLATATDGNWFDESVKSTNGLMQVWDTRNGKKIGPPISGYRGFYALAFNPVDEKSLFTGDQLTRARLWNAVTIEERFPSLVLTTTLFCLDLSPDGRLTAMGNEGGEVYVIENQTGRLYPPMRHNSWVECVKFTSDSKRLLSTSDDGTVKLWSLPVQNEADSLKLESNVPDRPEGYIKLNGPPSGLIAIPIHDRSLRLIAAKPLVERHRFPYPSFEDQFRFGLNDGKHWITVPLDNRTSSGPRATLISHIGDSFQHLQLDLPISPTVAGLTPDGATLFTLSPGERMIRAWRTGDGTLIKMYPTPPDRTFTAFTRDHQGAIWSNHVDESVTLHSLESGVPIGRPIKLGMFGDILAFESDWPGRRWATVGVDKIGRVFDLLKGEMLVQPFKLPGDVFDVEWSPDNRRIITAGLDNFVRMWDSQTGEFLLTPMSVGFGAANDATWSPDGLFVVTRSLEGFEARVWDAATTEPITPLFKHSGVVKVAIVTCDHRLITLSYPNLLRAWDLQPTKLPADILKDYALLLAGQKLNSSGALIPIKPAEMAELFESLRARAPELFTE